jgi:hypothetical protein
MWNAKFLGDVAVGNTVAGHRVPDAGTRAVRDRLIPHIMLMAAIP